MRTFVHIRARSFFSSPVMYWAWSRFSRPILLYISVQIAYKCVHLYTNVGGVGGEICRVCFGGIYRVYTHVHTCKYSAPPPPNYTPKITTPPPPLFTAPQLPNSQITTQTETTLLKQKQTLSNINSVDNIYIFFILFYFFYYSYILYFLL